MFSVEVSCHYTKILKLPAFEQKSGFYVRSAEIEPGLF